MPWPVVRFRVKGRNRVHYILLKLTIVHPPLCVEAKGAIPGRLGFGPEPPDHARTELKQLISKSLPFVRRCLCLKLKMRW
jgi:hypothetical protein